MSEAERAAKKTEYVWENVEEWSKSKKEKKHDEEIRVVRARGAMERGWNKKKCGWKGGGKQENKEKGET